LLFSLLPHFEEKFMDINSIQVTSAQTANASKAERTGSPAQTVVNSAASGLGPAAAREDVEAAVATIQDFVQSVSRSLNFSLEEGSGRVVVKVTDVGSGDVIRQIPSEEALQLAENLSEVRSLLFKAEA
jgi:flagellar protein FlaG